MAAFAAARLPPLTLAAWTPVDPATSDYAGLYGETLRVLRHWMDHGVRIFRVDNPHTKPVAFWERVFGSIHATDPDVLFLAEAFTKPPMMKLLGEVGFQQSYTYFTWRNEKWELEEYFRELSGPLAASMRPNVFVNTPDILSAYLQYGGPAAFAIRATLAATLSPTWGVYAGFELFEHSAVRPGSEEYLDSEKYQYRPRDWAAADESGTTLAPYLGQLNAWRRAHPSLGRLRNLTFHGSNNDKIIAYSKREGDDVVLVVCTLDPHGAREGVLDLDLDICHLAFEVGGLDAVFLFLVVVFLIVVSAFGNLAPDVAAANQERALGLPYDQDFLGALTWGWIKLPNRMRQCRIRYRH